MKKIGEILKERKHKRKEEKQEKKTFEEYEKKTRVIENHKYFDPETFRIKLPKEELEELPFKELNKTEQYINLCQELDFNSINCYSSIIPIEKGEVGHDLNFRYIFEEGK